MGRVWGRRVSAPLRVSGQHIIREVFDKNKPGQWHKLGCAKNYIVNWKDKERERNTQRHKP